jgi:hypothetical protein
VRRGEKKPWRKLYTRFLFEISCQKRWEENDRKREERGQREGGCESLVKERVEGWKGGKSLVKERKAELIYTS